MALFGIIYDPRLAGRFNYDLSAGLNPTEGAVLYQGVGRVPDSRWVEYDQAHAEGRRGQTRPQRNTHG